MHKEIHKRINTERMQDKQKDIRKHKKTRTDNTTHNKRKTEQTKQIIKSQ